MSDLLKGWKRSIDKFPDECIDKFLVCFIPYDKTKPKFEVESLVAVGQLAYSEKEEYAVDEERILISTPSGYELLSEENFFRDTDDLKGFYSFFYWKELDE